MAYHGFFVTPTDGGSKTRMPEAVGGEDTPFLRGTEPYLDPVSHRAATRDSTGVSERGKTSMMPSNRSPWTGVISALASMVLLAFGEAPSA